MPRISIAGMLVFVIAFALGFAALINGADLWRGATFLLMLAALLGSVLGILRGRWREGFAVGFALFGWGYLLIGLVDVFEDHMRQWSDPVARWAFDLANPPPPPTPTPIPAVPTVGRSLVPIAMNGAQLTQAEIRHRRANAGLIGHWLAGLCFAMAGGYLGLFLSRRRSAGGVADRPA